MFSSLQIPSYTTAFPYPHGYQDNFLDVSFANALQKEILSISPEAWDRYENPFEKKYTLRDKYSFPPLLTSLFEKLESAEFVEELSKLTGHQLLLDPTRNFWGVHKYDTGDKLDIHVDAGLHPKTDQKKQVTLGLYVSSNWKEEYGCKLEIWKGTNAGEADAKLERKVNEIAPVFNRLILFTCTDYSWHGNPVPADCPSDAKRTFITISYLSENYSDKNKKKKALFVALPDEEPNPEKDELRRRRADPEQCSQIYSLNQRI